MARLIVMTVAPAGWAAVLEAVDGVVVQLGPIIGNEFDHHPGSVGLEGGEAIADQ